MSMRTIYALLALLGVILPYTVFGPWLVQNGLAVGLLWDAATANSISLFAWLDVIVSGVALLAFIFTEGRRLQMTGLWIPVVALFSVGVSLALPLFLYMREGRLARGS